MNICISIPTYINISSSVYIMLLYVCNLKADNLITSYPNEGNFSL